MNHENEQITPAGRQISPLLAILLVVGFGVLTLVAAWVAGVPLGADLDAHFRFVQPFYDEVASGNWSPGWLAESNNGFGDARFRFYPPLMFYVLSAFRSVTGNWYAATLAAFTLFSVIGAVGAYLWARQNFARGSSIMAAAVFAFVPYHLTQFYQASLLLEFAVSAFLPFAFLFTERLITEKRLRPANIAGLAVSYALIVLTHVPTTIIASISLGIFALILTNWRENKRALAYAASAIALGLLLSSPFWIKVVTELEWVQAGHKVTSEYYNYRNNFLFSPFSPPSLNTWYAGMIAALTVAFSLPALVILRTILRHKATGAESILLSGRAGSSPCTAIRAAIIVALFAFLMTTDLSRPVWWLVPKLGDIQFPFRWLSIMSVVICPVVGYALSIWWQRIVSKQIRAWQAGILGVFAIAAGYSVYELIIQSTFLDRTAFTEHIEGVRGGPSFSDWLPVGAAEIKDLKPMTGPIDPNGREVLSTSIQTHHRRFTLAAGQPTDIRIRTYYYPLWQATVTTASGTTKAQIKKAEDGTLLVTVPAESCEVSVDFRSR